MSAGVILIVDDTPGNLDLLVDLLEKHDYDVRVARCGRRALAAAAAAPPDLVMLDINMPEMDGYEVCRRLKAAEATREIPVIFLSVNDEAMDKVLGFRAGGADYVTKPFQPEEVLARVDHQVRLARLQRDLVAEREAAFEASRAKSVFLANMSHELRTPLNGILGYVQLMERDESLTEAQRENLGVIMRSGEHLLALINDVLSISKIEAGQATLNERTFDLARLLQGLEEMFRVRAEAQGLHLIFDLAPTLPRHASGDDGKLRQILINLLGNAFKFTDSGGVALRAGWEEGIARFEVEDTGHGIAPDELGRIFEPFVQTEAGVRSGEGTGLGLTITHNFVELMGGRIEVRSEVGKGTAFGFNVLLPAAAPVAHAATRRVVGLEPDEPAYRVLVADDKDANRRVLVELLPALGFEVREAATGREAVDVWAEWRPDLIFMDMHMPEMDGYDATREIRRSETVPGAVTTGSPAAPVKIVALSASVFERDRKGILESGCDDFVGKPFRQEVIFEKLAAHLGARFRYEAPPRPAATAPLTPIPVIAPERLAGLADGQRSSLREAVMAGDREAAFRVADEIGSSDAALAADLRALIKAYRFDDIIELVGNA
jgi:signal transduction histidine kinase